MKNIKTGAQFAIGYYIVKIGVGVLNRLAYDFNKKLDAK